VQLAESVLRVPPRPARAAVAAFGLSVALTAFSSLFVVAGGAWIRFIFAVAFGLLLIAVTLARPALGITATFVYLVFEAMMRRMLIPVAPWVSADPMLLVGPLVAVVLIVKAFVLDSRPWAPDVISKLVIAVLVITLAEVFNPAGGGIGAGVAGLMFMAVPLLWFFVGREFLRPDQQVERLLAVVVVLGTIVACYGLWQTIVGDPPWDVDWLQTPGAVGYNSLYVGGTARAFGTFSGFSEYGLFVGTALVLSIAFLLRGRLIAVLPLPVLAGALFLASGRAALITAAFAVVVMLGLRTRRPTTALIVTVAGVGAAFLGLHFGGAALSSAASGSSALVSHQIGGLANPLDPSSSTLLVHAQLVIDGFKSGVSHPFGQGTAVTNNAAGLVQSSPASDSLLGVVGQGSKATEMDISNAFVALGIPGGVLYLLLVVLVLVQALRSYFSGRDVLLPIIGALLVDAGQWAVGGSYALSPLMWTLIGVVAAVSWDVAKQRKAGVDDGSESARDEPARR
jgi:hypothetical protein